MDTTTIKEATKDPEATTKEKDPKDPKYSKITSNDLEPETESTDLVAIVPVSMTKVKVKVIKFPVDLLIFLAFQIAMLGLMAYGIDIRNEYIISPMIFMQLSINYYTWSNFTLSILVIIVFISIIALMCYAKAKVYRATRLLLVLLNLTLLESVLCAISVLINNWELVRLTGELSLLATIIIIITTIQLVITIWAMKF